MPFPAWLHTKALCPAALWGSQCRHAVFMSSQVLFPLPGTPLHPLLPPWNLGFTLESFQSWFNCPSFGNPSLAPIFTPQSTVPLPGLSMYLSWTCTHLSSSTDHTVLVIYLHVQFPQETAGFSRQDLWNVYPSTDTQARAWEHGLCSHKNLGFNPSAATYML